MWVSELLKIIIPLFWERMLFPLAGGDLDDQVKSWAWENPEYHEESRYETSRVITFRKFGNFAKGLMPVA
jgi:hypothetical protein